MRNTRTNARQHERAHGTKGDVMYDEATQEGTMGGYTEEGRQAILDRLQELGFDRAEAQQVLNDWDIVQGILGRMSSWPS
jgi:hypothetical protein